MIVWRIAQDRYPLLDGGGAAEFGGRWNSRGRRVIYAGESFAIAVLEKLAHLPMRRLPRNQVFAPITVPDELVERIDADALVGWDSDDMVASRAFGDAWFDARRSLAMLAPSVVTRIDHNVLLNQDHPDFARIHAEAPQHVAWDHRLFRR